MNGPGVYLNPAFIRSSTVLILVFIDELLNHVYFNIGYFSCTCMFHGFLFINSDSGVYKCSFQCPIPCLQCHVIIVCDNQTSHSVYVYTIGSDQENAGVAVLLALASYFSS